MSEELLTWFKDESSSAIISKWNQMLIAILGTSEEFNTAIGFCEEESLANASSAIKRLEQKESEADELLIELFSFFKEIEVRSKVFTDILTMFRFFDKIANYIKCAARNLNIILELSIAMPKIIVENFSAMSSKLVEMNASLIILNKIFHEENISDTIVAKNFEDEIDRIKQGESEIDDLYYETKKLLSTTDRKAGTIILLNDLLEAIENAADVCNEIATFSHVVIR